MEPCCHNSPPPGTRRHDSVDMNATRSIHHVLGLQSAIQDCVPAPELASIWKVLPPPNASSSHGSFYKTVCGPVIGLSGEVGTTASFVPSTDRLWKRRITYSHTVDLCAGSGTRSPLGSDCLTCNRQFGQRLRPHWSGGSPFPRDNT
jgi:hypothetical protein